MGQKVKSEFIFVYKIINKWQIDMQIVTQFMKQFQIASQLFRISFTWGNCSLLNKVKFLHQFQHYLVICSGRICAEMLPGYYLREGNSGFTFQVLAANKIIKIASLPVSHPGSSTESHFSSAHLWS